MSLVVPEAHVQFQHILRLLNTNVDGKRKIMVRLALALGGVLWTGSADLPPFPRSTP